MIHWLDTLLGKRMPLVPREDNFQKSLAFVLAREGGLVNNPNDLGGLSKYGISLKNHPLMTRNEIINLTPQQAGDIYRKSYWQEASCDSYAWPLCLIVFDTAVNMGVGRAKEFMEKISKGNTNEMSKELIAMRIKYYNEIALNNPKEKEFLAGWLNRVNLLKENIV